MSNRVLHLLSQESESTPPNATRVPAQCGHLCVASPHTHAMLADASLEHVVVCVDCYTKET